MILIKNGKIYTMEGEVLENYDLLIRHGKIENIGKNIPEQVGFEVIDASGKLIFPGFIDAHCHLGMWEDSIGFEGADGNEASDPITPHMRSIDAINPMDINFKEALEGGVTAVATGPGSANIVSGTFSLIKTWGNRIDDMIVKDPIAMKIAFGENPKRVYGEKSKTPMTRMAIAAELRSTLYKAKEYLEKKKAGKEYTFDLKMEAFEPVFDRVIPLKAHAHRADDLFTAIRVAKEFGLKITLDHVTEGHLIVDELKGENLDLIVGPSFGERSKFELKNKTFETPGILSKAGLNVAIMTDHPVIPIQHLNLCAALSYKSGMDEMEALKAITINPAKILGVDDKMGSIKVGKDADISIWDKHPFDLDSNVCQTIVNGIIVYRKSEI
jgi:imidazolonepropionase-like amidohydrolase